MSIQLTDYLTLARIDLEMTQQHREAVLERLVQLCVQSNALAAHNDLLEVLLAREGLGSTGIGHGVAIPHGRSDQLKHTCLALGRTIEPIPFDAVDGHPSQLFFLLASPQDGNHEHLFLLSRVAKLMKNPGTRQALLQLQTPAQVFALLQEREQQF